MKYKKFILESFKKLDDGDKIGFVSSLSEDIEWIENRTEVYKGKISVKEQISKVYSTIANTCHTFLNVWEVDNTYVITADLSVNTTDKIYEDIPWTAVVTMKDGFMKKVEVYSDTKKILEEDQKNQ